MEVGYLVGGIIGGTFLLMGGIFLFFGLKRSRPTKNWNMTNGKIIKKEKHIAITLSKIINNESFILDTPDSRPTVQYEVAGTPYENTSFIQQRPGLKPGTVVEVFYDPENPGRAIINTFAQKGTIFTVLGGIFITISCVVLLVMFIVVG